MLHLYSSSKFGIHGQGDYILTSQYPHNQHETKCQISAAYTRVSQPAALITCSTCLSILGNHIFHRETVLSLLCPSGLHGKYLWCMLALSLVWQSGHLYEWGHLQAACLTVSCNVVSSSIALLILSRHMGKVCAATKFTYMSLASSSSAWTPGPLSGWLNK